MQIGQFCGVSQISVRSIRDQIRSITDQYLSPSIPAQAAVFQEPPKTSVQMRSLAEQIRKSYLDDLTKGIVAKPIMDKSNPGVELTRDQIAVAVALDMSGKKTLSSDDRIRYNKMLYDSIHDLVYQRASRYVVTCPEESVDDLAQECLYQLMKKLHGFNPKRGAFSTWSWHVCKGTLNRKYRNGQRDRRNFVDASTLVTDDGESIYENLPEKPIEGVQTNECPGILAIEIMDAVRGLAAKHPEQKAFIHDMFGNPDSEDFVMPSYINVFESAQAVGMEYNRARSFYSTVVRPFMRSQLEG